MLTAAARTAHLGFLWTPHWPHCARNQPPSPFLCPRLQSKGYKSGGWVCVVLSLVPAPAREEEEEEDGGLCDDDEGDATGRCC